MSERQHKKARKNLAHARIIYLQSEGEYGEPPRKRPLPPRTMYKGKHTREIPADYPNRAQRRAVTNHRPSVEVALQRLKFEGRRSDEGVIALNAERKQNADNSRRFVAEYHAARSENTAW